jgi:predicted amidohydrolase
MNIKKQVLLVSILGLLTRAGLATPPLRFSRSGFTPASNGLPVGWRVWASRAEIAPRTFVDHAHSRAQPGSLAISGNHNAAAYGGWEYTVTGIEPGKWYRLVAWYRAEGLHYEPLQVLARLDWASITGEPFGPAHNGRSIGRAGQPNYAYRTNSEGEWTRLALEAPAPKDAGSVTIQLYLANAPGATVWWDDISLEEIPSPGPRPVTIATIKYHPKETHSAVENVRQFVETVEKTVTGKTDIVLLPEGMTVAGTGKSYDEVAESVPGPTTVQLGGLAKQKNAYIVAGLLEREGVAVYNTAVLIDRQGKLVGKYRKVYLPREEIEDGLTPGNHYLVFQTDFGTVGLMICWDSHYADPARALALQGAELILMPIWDGNEVLTKARAIENQVFLVTSSYGDPSLILDPEGKTLAMATQQGAAAISTIDLNRRYDEKHLGNMKERFMKELRLDVHVSRPRFTH